MSVLSSRVGLIHQCDTQRDQNAGTPDPWGATQPPNWQPHLTGQPCRAISDAVRHPVDDQRIAFIETRTLFVSLDADITEQDRIADVTDRHGNTILPGPMIILGRIAYPDHAELALEQIR